jgi:pSer/pThr/pTyr-binding forkhead associated (FHA) protein
MPDPGHRATPTLYGRLVVCGTDAVVLFPPGKTDLVIGRRDLAENILPDIDLTDYGALDRGVSRRHARFFVRGAQLFVEDLGSTNATFVNQVRLPAGQPHPLNDGDTLWLGFMESRFYTR